MIGHPHAGRMRSLLALTLMLLVGGATALGSAATTPFSVASSIANGQTLHGHVRWTATVAGVAEADVASVSFLVDGVTASTERSAPYVFGGDRGTLDTTTLLNGQHELAVVAT